MVGVVLRKVGRVKSREPITASMLLRVVVCDSVVGLLRTVFGNDEEGAVSWSAGERRAERDVEREGEVVDVVVGIVVMFDV